MENSKSWLPTRGAAWALLVLLAGGAHSGVAADRGYEAGLRANALFGDGVPANDMIGFGAELRYYLHRDWFVGAALERYAFDFERTARAAGVEQDPAVKDIDAEVDTTVISAFIGRFYGQKQRGFNGSWTAGLGIGLPDIGNATGVTSTGGTFDIATDAGTEFHLMSSATLRYQLNANWSLGVTARAEHHFIDYQSTDRVSGSTGTVDSQSPLGVHFGLNYRFD